nr:MAG TPA: hypothetical protein [Caudoviricetes sp.]
MILNRLFNFSGIFKLLNTRASVGYIPPRVHYRTLAICDLISSHH